MKLADATKSSWSSFHFHLGSIILRFDGKPSAKAQDASLTQVCAKI